MPPPGRPRGHASRASRRFSWTRPRNTILAQQKQLYGEVRPKQYAVLAGSTSLLRQTLDRVALVIPPPRTVVVTMASHARYLEAELTGLPDAHVLSQPSDRGTAAGVLLPAHWIRVRDPRATVVGFPADHFIRYALPRSSAQLIRDVAVV